MAVTTVQVRRARGLVALSIRVGRWLDALAGVTGMLVCVVTGVPRTRDLVPAVRRHGPPAELEWQQDEQDEGDELTHKQEFSGYRVLAGIGRATGLWGFTTSRRGRVRRCGSCGGG